MQELKNAQTMPITKTITNEFVRVSQSPKYSENVPFVHTRNPTKYIRSSAAITSRGASLQVSASVLPAINVHSPSTIKANKSPVSSPSISGSASVRAAPNKVSITD